MPDEKDFHPDSRLDPNEAEAAHDEARPVPPEEGDGVSAPEDPSPHDEHVEQLLQHTIDVPILASAVDRQEAPDAADTLEKLEEEEAVEILHEMEDEKAADALAEMEPALAVGVIEDLIDEKPEYVGQLVELMDDDKAVDLVQTLDVDYQNRLFEVMAEDPARLLASLIRYDRESAGGMMTTDFLALREDMTLKQAIQHIRELHGNHGPEMSDHVQSALVTDDEEKIVGIVALYRLLLADPMNRIADIMKKNVRVVHPEMDREEVAREFDRYDYSMLPVVDEHDRLLGIVTGDDVIDIIRAEQTEDVQKTVGAGAREAVYSGVLDKFKGRFPWLLISLIMMLPAAIIIFSFKELIGDLPVLAVLMPVIAAVVGNAGHQALAVTQRGIVLDEVRPERVWPLLGKEWGVGILNGFVLGVIIFLGVGLLSVNSDSVNWELGFMTGLGTMVAMSVGTLFGSGIPLLMKRLGFDPAQSSAIFLIMITDAVAFGVILSLALFIYEKVDFVSLF